MASQKKLEPYKQDLDKAEALLDEAGWIDRDNDGVRDKEIDGRSVPFDFRSSSISNRCGSPSAPC
jgi:Bacterial extracellular solute-binding proteins, family 5 Middle.